MPNSKKINENYYGYNKKVFSVDLDSLEEYIPEPENDAFYISHYDDIDLIESCYSQLSERQKYCIQAILDEGLTTYEIAERLNISRSSVRRHIDRAVKRIQNIMEMLEEANGNER